MTTDLKTANKFLAYDGDCPMCTSSVRLLVRLKLVTPEQTRSNHLLTEEDLKTAQAAGIRNQLVVIDPRTREARKGTDGLLWILRDNTGNHFLVRLLGLPGFRHALRWGYAIVSYNRRIISPPRHQIVCDCEPEVTLARRLSMVVPALIVTIAITAIFGAAVFRGWELGDALTGAWFMEVAAGSGWVALVLAAAALLPREKLIDYFAHLTMTMLAGVLLLVPASLLTPLVSRQGLIALDCLSVLASFSLMFKMQQRRVKALAISSRWLWAWVVAFLVGAGATTYFYFTSGTT